MNSLGKTFVKSEKREHLVHYLIQEKQLQTPCSSNLSEIELVDVNHNNKLDFFRIWYAVGKKWNWVGKLIRGDEGLENDINNNQISAFIIQFKKENCGIAEFKNDNGKIEISYFGVKDNFIGKGIAKIAFSLLLEKIQLNTPKQIWLHTCSLDSPKALPFYRKFGFRTYKIQNEWVDLYKET